MLVLGNFLTMNPGKLVLVVVQVKNSAIGNGFKFLNQFPVNLSLHLDGANHVFTQSAI